MGQKIRLNQCLQKQDFQPLQGPLSSSQLVHTMYTYIIMLCKIIITTPREANCLIQWTIPLLLSNYSAKACPI